MRCRTPPAPADRWATTLTKRFLSAELTAGRTPKETASQVGCAENTVRDHLVRHGLLDVSGAPRSLARDYERLGSITAVADLHGASFVHPGQRDRSPRRPPGPPEPPSRTKQENEVRHRDCDDRRDAEHGSQLRRPRWPAMRRAVALRQRGPVGRCGDWIGGRRAVPQERLAVGEVRPLGRRA